MKSKIKRKFYKSPFFLIIFSLLIIYVISFLVPVFWAFVSSFKSNDDFIRNAFGFPKKWNFSNYAKVYKELYVRILTNVGYKRVFLPKLMLNAALYSVGATLISVFCHAIPAYIAAKYRHWFISKLMYAIVIVTMLLPIVGNLPSELSILRSLGLYDKVYGVWFMKAGFLGTDFLILYATFKGISWEYAEAAFMDGASNTGVLFKIMLPLATPTLFAVGIVSFITNWNDWRVNVVYLPSFPTISYALYYFENNPITSIATPPFKLAACILVMLPVLIFFVIFRDKLMGNLTMGGIKG